jgi:hypothetical protein
MCFDYAFHAAQLQALITQITFFFQNQRKNVYVILSNVLVHYFWISW